MRVTKQPSRGRGEYEIADTARNGLTPSDLLGHVIRLRFGPYEVITGVRVTHQGGKWRLRRLPGTQMQVQLQVAGVLMMPKPVRDETLMEGGQPVLQTNRYIIKDIELGRVELEGNNAFWAEVSLVYYGNQAYQAEQLDVRSRITEVEAIWRRRTEFPPDIAAIIQQHEAVVRSGNPIPQSVITLVGRLQGLLASYSNDIGIVYDPNTDVLPALSEALGEVIQSQPISLDQIEPEQIELRRREIKKWQSYVSRRGSSSVKFKKAVRDAYGSRCIMCGSYFPVTKFNQRPGIDSAHILPWATYDLDRVCNGVALCKLHHWAFDEGLLRIVYRNGIYFIELSADAENGLGETGFSLAILSQVVGEIPMERLPANPQDRPHPELLRRLNEEYNNQALANGN